MAKSPEVTHFGGKVLGSKTFSRSGPLEQSNLETSGDFTVEVL